jgi:hypothetical protein
MKVLSLLEATFFSATEKLAAGNKTLSAVNIRIDPARGELLFFGEDDYTSPKGKVTIYDWIIKKNEEQTHYRHRISGLLRNAFISIRGKRIFTRSCITRPFYIYLIDHEGHRLEQIFTLTEKDQQLSPSPHTSSPSSVHRTSSTGNRYQPLLPNLERDLDIFLEKLLPELK